MDEEKMKKTGERAGKKRKGDSPQGSRGTNNGRRRSLLRRTRAHGKRTRAPEGRKGRKTGGEVRSGKNAVIKVGRRKVCMNAKNRTRGLCKDFDRNCLREVLLYNSRLDSA